MSSPTQIDQRMFQAKGDDPTAAMESIRERAQAVHPDTVLYLEVMGAPSREGMYTVLADYWRFPEWDPDWVKMGPR